MSGLRLNISPIRKFRHKLNLGLLERTNINLNYLNTTKLIDELLLAKNDMRFREKGQMSFLKLIKRNSGFDCGKYLFDNVSGKRERF